MNVSDAAYHTVRNYPGGAEALATRLTRIDEKGEQKCMAGAVLRSKVNPNTSTHHLTLAEADQIMAITGDHRILHALAGTHGYALVAVGAEQGAAATSLMQAVLGANAAEGSFDQKLAEALADDRISPRELAELTDLAVAQQAAMTRLVAKLSAVAASQRPDLRAVAG